MELYLSPKLQAKLDRMAAQRGLDANSYAQETLERSLDYEEWFSAQVQEGIAESDHGEFIEHEDVRKMIERRYRR
jgi:predicted transcriptional regulator